MVLVGFCNILSFRSLFKLSNTFLYVFRGCFIIVMLVTRNTWLLGIRPLSTGGLWIPSLLFYRRMLIFWSLSLFHVFCRLFPFWEDTCSFFRNLCRGWVSSFVFSLFSFLLTDNRVWLILCLNPCFLVPPEGVTLIMVGHVLRRVSGSWTDDVEVSVDTSYQLVWWGCLMGLPLLLFNLLNIFLLFYHFY